MSLNGLNGRIQRLEEKAPKPPDTSAGELNLSLFTDEEQAHIKALLHVIGDDFDYLYRLTDDQLEYVHLALQFNELDRPESEQACRYRRQMDKLSASPHFMQRLDRLVEVFLSLDEQRIPDYAEVSEWWKQRESLPPDYHMRRAYYKQRKEHVEEVMARSKKWHPDGLWGIGMHKAEMLRWVEAYGNLEDL